MSCDSCVLRVLCHSDDHLVGYDRGILRRWGVRGYEIQLYRVRHLGASDERKGKGLYSFSNERRASEECLGRAIQTTL